MLLKEYPNIFEVIIPYTTREPSPDESSGKDFYFVTEEEFKRMADEGKLLECSVRNGYAIGTAKADVEKVAKEQRIAILKVDVLSAQKINQANVDANYMFIYPPSPDELKERISHKIEDDDAIKNALEQGLREVEAANKTILYKHKVINNKLETSYEEFKELLLRIYKEEIKVIESKSS